MIKRLPPKRTIDRVGGVGSIFAGVICALIGGHDWQEQHSIWKVWAFMCVLLIVNGIAMLVTARRAAGLGRVGAP